MANKIQYGLDFELASLNEALAVAQKFEQSIKDAAKAMKDLKIPTLGGGGSTSDPFEPITRGAKGAKVALEDVRLAIEKAKIQLADSDIIQPLYRTQYKLKGYGFDSSRLAISKQENAELKKLTAQQLQAETMLYNQKKRYFSATKNLTKAQLKELEQLHYNYYKEILGQDEKYSRQLAAGEMKNLNNRVNAQKQALNTVSRVAKYIATSTVVYQGFNAFRAGITGVVEYDQALGNLRAALIGVTDEQFQMLKQMSVSAEYANQFGLGATEVSQAMVVLSKAGLNASEVIATLNPALQLAKAGELDLKDATEVLIRGLAGFGEKAGSAQYLTDLLALGDIKSVTTVEKLSEAFRVAAPVGRQFGMSMRETVAWLGALSSAGYEGANAGNVLARIYQRLTSSIPAVVSGLKKYNISLYDSNNRIKPLITLTEEFNKKMIPLADQQKILGIYAQKGFAALSAVTGQYKELNSELQNAEGSAKKLVDIKMDTMLGSIKKLQAAWENLFIALSTGSTGGIKSLIDTLTALINKIAEFPTATAELIKLVTVFGTVYASGKALMFLIPILNSLKVAVMGAAGSFTALSTAAKFNLWVAGISIFLTLAEALYSFSSAANDATLSQEELNKKIEEANKQLLDESNFLAKHRDNIKTWSKQQLQYQVEYYDKLKEKDDQALENSKKNLTQLQNKLKEVANERPTEEGAIFYQQGQIKNIQDQIKEEKKKQEVIQKSINQKNQIVALDRQEASLRKPDKSLSEAELKDIQQRNNNYQDFLDSITKMANKYSEKVVPENQKRIMDIENSFSEARTELWKKEFTQKQKLEADWKLQIAEIDALALEEEKQFQDAKKKVIENYLKEQKDNLDKLKQSEYEFDKDKIDRLAELYTEIDNLDKDQQIKQLQNKRDELLNLTTIESQKLEISRSYNQQIMDIEAERWKQSNEVGSAFLDSFKAGYDTMLSSITDMNMTGTERLNQIWTSFRDTAIKAMADIAIKAGIVKPIIDSLGTGSGVGNFLAKLFDIVPALTAITATTISGETAKTAAITSSNTTIAASDNALAANIVLTNSTIATSEVAKETTKTAAVTTGETTRSAAIIASNLALNASAITSTPIWTAAGVALNLFTAGISGAAATVSLAAYMALSGINSGIASGGMAAISSGLGSTGGLNPNTSPLGGFVPAPKLGGGLSGSLPQNTNSLVISQLVGMNNQLTTGLDKLAKRIAVMDANNVSTMKATKTVVNTQVIGDDQVYNATKRGEKKIAFITN